MSILSSRLISQLEFFSLPAYSFFKWIKFYSFYPTALKGCRGIVFIHGVRMGKRLGRRVGGGKKFVWAVSQKL